MRLLQQTKNLMRCAIATFLGFDTSTVNAGIYRPRPEIKIQVATLLTASALKHVLRTHPLSVQPTNSKQEMIDQMLVHLVTSDCHLSNMLYHDVSLCLNLRLRVSKAIPRGCFKKLRWIFKSNISAARCAIIAIAR